MKRERACRVCVRTKSHFTTSLWACRSFRRASSVSRRLEVGSIMSSRSSGRGERRRRRAHEKGVVERRARGARFFPTPPLLDLHTDSPTARAAMLRIAWRRRRDPASSRWVALTPPPWVKGGAEAKGWVGAMLGPAPAASAGAAAPRRGGMRAGVYRAARALPLPPSLRHAERACGHATALV